MLGTHAWRRPEWSGPSQRGRGRVVAALGATMILGLPAIVWAADPSIATAAAAGFSVTLTATQHQHAATLLNVKYDRPDRYCKDGLLSYSTEQTMTIRTDPVMVDMVKLDSPPADWGSQEVFLIPQGGSVEDVIGAPPSGYLYDALPQVELPGTVSVDRAYSKPATGISP